MNNPVMPQSENVMVRLDKACLVMDNTTILDNITFQVGKGEFVYILGPSGAGKSSILKLIHMDLMPTAGTVWVRESDTRRVRKKDVPFMRRQIGFVFQDYKLLQERTAFENVAFALEVTGKRGREVKQKALHALNTVGMAHRINHYPRKLSGGECQRVAIARAVVQEPFILLADEPTGNLDEENSWAILDLLQRINHAGTAVLMATHRVDFTNKSVNKNIKIAHGKII